jgi:hypothetical protein
MAHLIGIDKYKKNRLVQSSEGKLKIFMAYDKPPCFAAFWCNKHCTFKENGHIFNFLKEINSNKTISLHYSDGISDTTLEDPLIKTPDNKYIMLLQSTRLTEESKKIIKNKLLCIPLDDDIFTMGLKSFLQMECGEAYNIPWEDKLPIVFYRGTPIYGSRRRPVVQILYGNPKTDARYVKTPWTEQDYFQKNKNLYDNRFDGSNPQPVTLADHMKYKYIICIGGVIIGSMFNWVFGSGSVPLLVSHPNDHWWFKPFIEPNVHYMPIEWDLSNLESTIDFLIQNDEYAKGIATNCRLMSEKVFSPEFQRQYLVDNLQ